MQLKFSTSGEDASGEDPTDLLLSNLMLSFKSEMLAMARHTRAGQNFKPETPCCRASGRG